MIETVIHKDSRNSSTKMYVIDELLKWIQCFHASAEKKIDTQLLAQDHRANKQQGIDSTSRCFLIFLFSQALQ